VLSSECIVCSSWFVVEELRARAIARVYCRPSADKVLPRRDSIGGRCKSAGKIELVDSPKEIWYLVVKI
jgi:hypothetical protein